jgi:hypothetical protein
MGTVAARVAGVLTAVGPPVAWRVGRDVVMSYPVLTVVLSLAFREPDQASGSLLAALRR